MAWLLLLLIAQSIAIVQSCFNALGLRLRHAICERWIREKRTLNYVLEQLPEANFDPEFFERYDQRVLGQCSDEMDVTLRPKARKGLFQRLFSQTQTYFVL